MLSIAREKIPVVPRVWSRDCDCGFGLKDFSPAEQVKVVGVAYTRGWSFMISLNYCIGLGMGRFWCFGYTIP